MQEEVLFGRYLIGVNSHEWLKLKTEIEDILKDDNSKTPTKLSEAIQSNENRTMTARGCTMELLYEFKNVI